MSGRSVGRVAPSIVETIGATPSIELARLTRGLPGRIVAKLDYLNPGFSRKDRIAREIVDEALGSGELRSGQPVVELTSGNTGTGLAIVCAVRGHPFVAVMSEGNSRERARMMQALGAEVVLVPQAPGSRPGQVTGEDLDLIEARHPGPELWAETEGRIDAFCDLVGTGGTYAGVTAALKARRPGIQCYVVEPEGAAVLAGHPVTDPRHRLQGAGYARALELLDGVPVDGYLQMGDEEAITVARRLAREEGVFAGFSSGAVVAAALRLLRGPHAGETVAVVLADSGLKYLSTDLWPAFDGGAAELHRG